MRAELQDEWPAIVDAERPLLVDLCRRMTGRGDVAEDLAQEALLQAWRNVDQLEDPSRRRAWLRAIARNECLQWKRRRGREAPVELVVEQPGQPNGDPLDILAGDFDVEIELERDELAALLDRAMARLPPETRRILLDRFIHERPQAQTACELGLTEGAVALRLHRGKLALRRILTTDLRDDALAFGLIDGETVDWQDTRIWCWRCGEARLLGRKSRWGDLGVFELKCPHCCAIHGDGLRVSYATTAHLPAMFQEVRGYRAIFSRVSARVAGLYPPALLRGVLLCPRCGCPMPIRTEFSDRYPSTLRQESQFIATCAAGHPGYNESRPGLAMVLPEGRRFWREQRRIRVLPERMVEAGGSEAMVSSFESLTGQARLDVVTERRTFAVIAIHGAPPERTRQPEAY